MSSQCSRSVPFSWPHAEYVVDEGFLLYLEVSHLDRSKSCQGWLVSAATAP